MKTIYTPALRRHPKRLWPLSRATYPKQYWPLAGDGEETLLQQTNQRVAGLEELQPPLLICNEDHRFNCCAEAKGYVAEQMRQVGGDSAANQAEARWNMQKLNN